MQDINTCTFSGRLTKDVELKVVEKGENVFSSATFTLAVNRKAKKDAQGNYVSEADFINFSATGALAENIVKYCHKGDELFLNSHYQSKSYEKNGQRVYYSDFAVNEVHFGAKSAGKNTSATESASAEKESIFDGVETADVDLNSNQFPWD